MIFTHSISIDHGSETQPPRLHYWLTDEAGTPLLVASEIIDYEAFTTGAEAQEAARQALITSAFYELRTEADFSITNKPQIT